MRALDTYNPISVALYYLAAAGIAMFCMHPILLFLSLCGALALCLLHRDLPSARTHLYFWVILILSALLNPLLSHNGATVLLVIADAPFTAEAL